MGIVQEHPVLGPHIQTTVEVLRAQEERPIIEILRDQWNPPYTIQNIIFHHEHHFLGDLLSVSAAANWRHNAFWFYVAILFILGQMALAGFAISFRFLTPYVPILPSFT